jgi:hypothetical protein
MGIVVIDELELSGGITITDVYININNIEIINSSTPNGKYSIKATKFVYLNKVKRESSSSTLTTGFVSIVTDNLTNIEEQLYTELKTEYTSYTDDL